MNIKVSPKHGVNPSMLKCFACGGDAGIALLGRMKDDAEAPREMVDGSLCKNCEDVVNQGGVMLIEVRDEDEGKENPYRTGRVWGMSKQWVDRALKNFKHKGIAFIPQHITKAMGFPS